MVNGLGKVSEGGEMFGVAFENDPGAPGKSGPLLD